jgi:predicted enzyme related to lactoylglutathione lyase
MPKHGRLVAVSLAVSDLDSSAALYRDAFGLDLRPGVDDQWIGGRHAEISWREGAYLHFALHPTKNQPTSGAQITFSVDDIDKAHGTAASAGAHVIHEPRTEPWGRSARYEDLDGNMIELTQHT